MAQNGTETLRRLRTAALMAPAASRVGPIWATAAMRLWFDWVVAELRECLSSVLGVEVALTPMSPSGNGALVPAFGASLRCLDRDVVVSLDLAAARAVVDTLTIGLGGLRGTGPLSEGELGALEFVVLDALDRLLRRLPIAPGDVRLCAFHSTAPPAGESPAHGAAYTSLAVGASAGLVRTEITGPGGTESPLTGPCRVCQPTESIGIRLLVGRIGLAPEELARVEPGDVVMLSASDPDKLLQSASIVTSTGWRLGPARVVTRSPTLLSVELSRFEPAPEELGDAAAPHLMIGTARLSTEGVARLSDGVRLDLEIPVQEPAVIFIGTEEVGVGELVMADGQVGLRVLRWRSAPSPRTPEKAPAT